MSKEKKKASETVRNEHQILRDQLISRGVTDWETLFRLSNTSNPWGYDPLYYYHYNLE